MESRLFGSMLILLLTVLAAPSTSAQTAPKPSAIVDNGGYTSESFLRSDYRQSAVVAYVDVKEIIGVDASDSETDCRNFTGVGYCSFLLRAEIVELYKGKIKTRTIEFSEGGEAQAMRNKERYLGERVVFLEKFVDDGKTHYQTIENSTRDARPHVLEKMRRIAKKRR